MLCFPTSAHLQKLAHLHESPRHRRLDASAGDPCPTGRSAVERVADADGRPRPLCTARGRPVRQDVGCKVHLRSLPLGQAGMPVRHSACERRQ